MLIKRTNILSLHHNLKNQNQKLAELKELLLSKLATN
jgi:hypothetical protein